MNVPFKHANPIAYNATPGSNHAVITFIRFMGGDSFSLTDINCSYILDFGDSTKNSISIMPITNNVTANVMNPYAGYKFNLYITKSPRSNPTTSPKLLHPAQTPINIPTELVNQLPKIPMHAGYEEA